jgi:hypothetical protein
MHFNTHLGLGLNKRPTCPLITRAEKGFMTEPLKKQKKIRVAKF